MTTSAELLDQLYRALTPSPAVGRSRVPWWPKGMFIKEIEAPPPPGQRARRGSSHQRRADALWIKAREPLIHGYEVKVSRSDLAKELADPSKAEVWKKYCDTWTLVVPSARMIEGYEIPEDWGIVASPTGRNRVMTRVKESPLLSPVNQNPAWNRILTWTAWQYEAKNRELKKTESELNYLRQLCAELREELSDAA